MAGGACMAGGVCGRGGMCSRGVCMVGGMRGRYYEIRSMSGRYASYWNAFLFDNFCDMLKLPAIFVIGYVLLTRGQRFIKCLKYLYSLSNVDNTILKLFLDLRFPCVVSFILHTKHHILSDFLLKTL